MVSWWMAAEDAAVEDAAAIVDASAAASRVLIVDSEQPVYGVAAVWVSCKFVFVFPDLCVCCQSAIQSASVHVISDQVTDAVLQV